MQHETCSVGGCTFRVYAPAGTGGLCKEHFLSFVTWRRKKGSAMFHKYAAMTMDERNTVLTEWSKTLAAE
ncbi:MAG: hypothetical protein KGI53_10040 [Nitrospirota bacterium]|nr:hypothetical protein [Nitrospirota bacterium]